jgi:RNA-binding protein
MTAASSARKQSLMTTGPLRRALRAHGHALRPLVQVGKSGATAALRAQLAQTLDDHELVKVKIAAECPQDRFAVASALAEMPGVNVVQILGRTVLVYKRHPHTPRFEGDKARARAAATEARGSAATEEAPAPARRARARR